jgi:hypothetical protein
LRAAAGALAWFKVYALAEAPHPICNLNGFKYTGQLVSSPDWSAWFRKSYIGWLVRSRVGPNFSDISFYDADVKLSYDVAPGQNLSLYTLGGHTNATTTRPTTTDFIGGAGDFYFSRLGWRSTINEHLVLASRAAYIRQPLVEHYFGIT